MKRNSVIAVFAAFTALAMPAIGHALTAAELVEKHIAARGGRAAWEALGALRLEGSSTGFSQTNPFVLLKTPVGHYHFDHVLGDKRVVTGWDGETAWWENHWYEAGAQKITGSDLGVVMRDIELPLTPFFDLEAAGHEVVLEGDADIDGMAVVAVRLTRKDGTSETWYFDPETFLEVARDSPGSDFGQPMDQRTVFDQFAPVGAGGAVMPHYIESQWYTRHRVLEIESVSTGVSVDESLFAMPPPIGMAPVLSMAGDWTVTAETRQRPDAEWSTATRTATITAELGRGLLRERMVAGDTLWERSLSYDRFRQQYVLTTINDRSPYLDIMRGTLEDGVVAASNLDTGTTRDVFGMKIYGRLTIKEITASGFVIEHESSIDGGEHWFTDARMTYARAGGSAALAAD